MTAYRPLRDIALDILRTWKNPYFGAEPYIKAMQSLDSMADNYGQESADDIVMYFLSNAKYWRGTDADRIKRELNGMLPERYQRKMPKRKVERLNPL